MVMKRVPATSDETTQGLPSFKKDLTHSSVEICLKVHIDMMLLLVVVTVHTGTGTCVGLDVVGMELGDGDGFLVGTGVGCDDGNGVGNGVGNALG